MAPAKSARAKKFAAFEEKAVKDYDPEANAPSADDSDSEADEDLEGTEHYVNVGKSRLRQKEAPALGPKYSGVKVSRAALDDSSDGLSEGESEEDDESGSEDSQEYDDPDTADLERDNIIDDDDEIDSDEAFEEGEEEAFRKRGFTFKDSKKAAKKDSKPATNGRSKRAVAADFMSGSESEQDEDDDEDAQSEGGSESDDSLDDVDSGDDLIDREAEESSDEEGSDEGSEDDESSEDEDEEDEDVEMDDARPKDNKTSLREMMQEGEKPALNIISKAAKEDAEKGAAIRKQRRTYDSLLNLRIRLQKGLVATNSFTEATEADDADKEPYEAAEEAAIKLWNAIDGFRASLLPEPKAGEKRKRDVATSTSTEELWEEMQATEERAIAKRKQVLEKWSTKAKNKTTVVNNNTRQLGTAKGSESLVSVLEDQMMLNSDRWVKRTQVPRSCAPVQVAKKVTEDPTIYDDADFYQMLLKELVDQRTNDSGTTGNDNVPTVRWTAIKEAKTRKQVDRRASKGRKLRFTVHEKLQNFMAPEDRRSWEDEAIDRLFGTLFGQRMQLKEDVSDEEDNDLAAEEEGLKLFRN
ncbi:transcription factor AATF/Che-1 [Diaporthe sp. PMI_573]|nr:transcription factor AATF/Che-1 [Diaporthaceae sp. PMI_573]